MTLNLRTPNGYAQRATTRKMGVSRFATAAEAANTDITDLAISPSTLSAAVPQATTTVFGTVKLTDNSSPVATKVYADALAIAGAPNASTTVKGLVEIATDAEAVAGTGTGGTGAVLSVTPTNLAAVFAAAPAIGGTTPAAGTFTTLDATGVIDFDVGGTWDSAGTAINIGNAADTDAINIGTGAAARTITLGNSSGATSIALNTGTGALNLGTNAVAHTVTIGNITGATAVNINAGSGGSTWTTTNSTLALSSGTGATNIGTDAAAKIITIGNSTGATSVVIDAGTGALNVGTNAVAHTITIGNTTGATAIIQNVGTGNFALDGVAGSTYAIGASTTTGTITIGGTAQTGTFGLGVSSGIMTMNLATGNGAKTLNVATGVSGNTLNVASGINTSAQTVNISTGAAGASSTVSVLSGNATAGTQTLNLATGTGGKTVNIASGAGANIVTIGSITTTSALNLLAGTGNFSLDGAATTAYTFAPTTTSGTINFGGTGANTGTVTLLGGTGAQTINLANSTGGKTVNIAAGAGANLVTIGSATGASALTLIAGTGNFSLDGAATTAYTFAPTTTSGTINFGGTGANTGTVTLLGGTGAQTINLANSTGGKTVAIATGAGANSVTIGSTNTTSSLTLRAGSGDITVTGTVKEIDAEFLFSSGTDLTVTQSPIMQSALTTGVAPTGVAGDVNLMSLQDGCLMEQFIIGTQTIIAPRMSANGLAIELDNTNAEGAEYNFGARNSAKHAYTIGTSAAFFVSATLSVADLSGCAPLMIGFRKVEANNATFANYTDYFAAGLNTATSAVNVTQLNELNAGGQTATDSTTLWTGGDTGTCTIKVLVSAAGVCTYTIDGGAPGVVAAMTFDNADVVMPFIHFVNGADVAGEVALKNFKCGFQA